LLYVPTLQLDDPCLYESAPYVPDAAVRRPDLPPTNYYVVALSPWTSIECARSYLDAARKDPIHAFIFYKPGNTSDNPPPSEDSEWDMGDKGKWKEQSRFPIYAVSGLAGQSMMFNLSLYSGDMTSIPFGSNISDLYSIDPSDYVRVWTELRVSTPSTLPSLWVYFLIVVGVLLFVITLISVLMHLVQNRRRASLRRRVRTGEVNLEGMGIKQLTVPMEHVKTFPLFTYHYEPSPGSPPTSPRSTGPGRARRGSRGTGTGGDRPPTTISVRASTFSEKSPTSMSAAFNVATDYQPACEICLQQFQNRVTVIRELSCGHIFHPECIDEFLHEVSSLCPLCKVSMLPKGHCPQITNAMVRRERAIRRLRDRIDVEDTEDEVAGPTRIQIWGNTVKKYILRPRTDDTISTTPTSTELQPRSRPTTVEKEGTGANQHRIEAGDDDAENPTEAARRRMRELAGSGPDDGEQQLTRCKSCHVLLPMMP